MTEKIKKTVFATIGTTKFDKLVTTLTQERTLRALQEKGFNNLIIQIGNGNLIQDSKQVNMTISHYRFKNSIYEDISKADLVISHAGAGSCLEVLSAKKPLIVVINEDLSDNHQLELANQFSSDKYIFACYCATLVETIKKMDVSELKEFPTPNPKLLSNYLDNLMGFQE